MPEAFPQMDLQELCGLPYDQLAARILKEYLTDYAPSFLEQAARKAYGEAFGGQAGRLVPVEKGLYALELWHGPTSAFKDYALQLMPRLLVQAKEDLGRHETTLILTATSGDTGKAALEGFCDLPGTRIAVFYPQNGTSQIQQLQMVTQTGQNLSVWAVEGNFDDAQTGVKRVFQDKAIAGRLRRQGVCLSSANSINLGRLLPQIVYYFSAYLGLSAAGEVAMGQPVDFCVPTGNFGDILAGYYAKRMGLPVGRLLCASNQNHVLTHFLRTGQYDTRREFYKTTSPSMDILVSSNLERLLFHTLQSCEAVRGLMGALAQNGWYQLDVEALARIQRDFAGGFATDGEAAEQIRYHFEKNGYLCDPHTAVAFAVARQYRADGGEPRPTVVLSTASPFKFPTAVLNALGERAPGDDRRAMRLLEELAGQTAPPGLVGLWQKEIRFTTVIRPAQISKAALGSL